MNTTTTTTTDFGSILGRDVWQRLADEYLIGAHSAPLDAEDDARLLAWHVAGLVDRTGDLSYRFDGVDWLAAPGQPYDGLADLKVDVLDGRATVSTDYCDHPVWSFDDNFRFRIWHDTAHVRSGLGFGQDDELRLFAYQAQGLGRYEVDALFCESVYQLAAALTLGGYPDTQYVRTLGPTGRAVRDLLLSL